MTVPRSAPALLLVLCLLSCATPAGPRGLRIAQLQEPSALNPLLLNGNVGIETASLIYSYLLKLDDKGKLIPDAAAAVPTLKNGGVSADGLDVTYHLRRGVRFSDGVELTAADVVFTVGAVMNSKTIVQSRLGYDQVATIRETGRYTVRIRLKHPYAPILVLLCAPGNVYPILPAHLLSRYPDLNRIEFNARPVGSGPYRVVEWRRSDRLILQANPYFRPRPLLRGLEILFMGDANAIVNRIKSGEIDGFYNADAAVVPQLEAISALRVTRTPVYGLGALIFNTRDPILRDVRVRRALASAIESVAVVNKGSHGVHDPYHAGRGLFMWAYNPLALRMPRYDPKKAARDLDIAGWRRAPDGIRAKGGRRLEINLIYEKESPLHELVATNVQQQLHDIGAAVSLRAYVVQQFAAAAQDGGPVYGGKFQIADYPFLPGLDPDVTEQFACDRIPPAGFNKPRYCNSEMDAALRAGVATFDRARRQAAYNVVQRIITRDLPMYLMYQSVQVNAFPSWLRGQATAVSTPFWNVAAWHH